MVEFELKKPAVFNTNLFYTYKDDGYVDLEVQLLKGYDIKDKTKMVPGVSTTSRTRPLMISSLEEVSINKFGF